jgi:hypothetical protein
MPAMSSYTRLASAVRQSTSGKALLESPHVIAEARKATAERRARVYIGYIVEFVARALAGVCLEHGRTADGRIDLSRNRLFTLSVSGASKRWILGVSKGPAQKRVVEFSLVLLGNGWGFGDIVRDGMKTVEQMMAQRVYERLLELLRTSEITREITDGEVGLLDPRLALEVSFVLPAEGTHRKAAVALGLLGAHHTTEDAQRFFKKRAPERHGVLGLDMWLNDSGRTIPWYRPFGPPAEDDPNLMDPATRAGSAAAAPAPVAQPVAMPAPVPVAMPAPVPVAMPAPMPAAQPAMESYALAIVQQWHQYAALAAQQGMGAAEFAQRTLFQHVTALASAQGQSAERLLATQRWQQITQSVMMLPGLTAEQVSWMTQQQSQAVAVSASQRGLSPEALLASQRWEQLAALLQPPPTMFAGVMPGMFPGAFPGAPFDPNAR